MPPVSEMCARTRRGSAVLLLLLMLIATAIVTQCIGSNNRRDVASRKEIVRRVGGTIGYSTVPVSRDRASRVRANNAQ